MAFTFLFNNKLYNSYKSSFSVLVKSIVSIYDNILLFSWSSFKYPIVLLFNDNKEYLGDCICNIDTTILFIKKDNIFKLFENKTILENYLYIISIKNSNLRQKLKLYSQKSIEDRIMFYLLSEQKRLNSNIIPINGKEQLAKYLNIPRPSLSRELINLKEKGIIEFDRYQIKIK